MSKGARKTGRFRGKSQRGVPSRTSTRRAVKSTVLIVGEGKETEPNYFGELKREDNVTAKFAVTVKKGHGFSPENVVEEAVKHKNRAESRSEDYDQVWCVLDVEGPNKRESLGKAVIIAQQNDITLCLSNPCFEIWLLSHFQRKARAYNDCRAVIVELNKHWQEHYKQKYEKDDQRIYQRISPRMETAIDNAQWVRESYHRDSSDTADCNSSTEVYRLVRQLVGPFQSE